MIGTVKTLFTSMLWADTVGQPWTIADVQAMADYTRQWYAAVSFGKLDLQIAVVPQFVKSSALRSSSGYNTSELRTQLVALGYDPSKYGLWLMLTQRDGAVGFKGLAGFPIWINCMDTDYNYQATLHEIGHNCGLNHPTYAFFGIDSNNVMTLPPLTQHTGGPSQTFALHDDSSAMGYVASRAPFSVPERVICGWLTLGTDVALHNSGSGDKTYTLTALEVPGGALYGIKIPMSSYLAESPRVYWLEYRTKTIAENGVQLRVTGDFAGYSIAHIERGNVSGVQYGLQPGTRVTDGTIAIDVVSMDGTQAIVRIQPATVTQPVPPPTPSTPPPTPTGNAMIVPQYQTAVAALVVGQITPAQLAAIDALRAQIVPDATAPIPTPSGTSLDGTTVPPAASLTDDKGGVWTIVADGNPAGGSIRLNGTSAGGGHGTTISWKAGQIKVLNAYGDWWLWSNGSWSRTSAP